jgi:hypothetical protein
MRVILLAALAVAAAQDARDEPTGDYKELLDRVALLEERLRLTNIPEVTDDENDERSLLEQFTDAAGDFIVNRLLPRSDAQCRWNYAKSVCVPRCECSFQHRAGDLTPSRACRLRPPDSFLQEEICDPDVSGERGTFEKVAGLIALKSERAFDQLLGFLRDAAPDTSPECDWSWSTKKCEPVERCVLRYRFGDFHLGRSCRLRPPLDDGFGELDEDFGRLDGFDAEAPEAEADAPADADFGRLDADEPDAAAAPADADAPAEAGGGGEEETADEEPAAEEASAADEAPGGLRGAAAATAPYGLGDDDRDATW